VKFSLDFTNSIKIQDQPVVCGTRCHMMESVTTRECWNKWLLTDATLG